MTTGDNLSFSDSFGTAASVTKTTKMARKMHFIVFACEDLDGWVERRSLDDDTNDGEKKNSKARRMDG